MQSQRRLPLCQFWARTRHKRRWRHFWRSTLCHPVSSNNLKEFQMNGTMLLKFQIRRANELNFISAVRSQAVTQSSVKAAICETTSASTRARDRTSASSATRPSLRVEIWAGITRICIRLTDLPQCSPRLHPSSSKRLISLVSQRRASSPHALFLSEHWRRVAQLCVRLNVKIAHLFA